jgi:hypothetical protein
MVRSSTRTRWARGCWRATRSTLEVSGSTRPAAMWAPSNSSRHTDSGASTRRPVGAAASPAGSSAASFPDLARSCALVPQRCSRLARCPRAETAVIGWPTGAPTVISHLANLTGAGPRQRAPRRLANACRARRPGPFPFLAGAVPASRADFLVDGPAPSWHVRVGTCLAPHFPGSNHRLCLDRAGLLVQEFGRRLFAILPSPAAKPTHSAAKETHSGIIGRRLADLSHPQGQISRRVQVIRACQRQSDEWPGCEYRNDRQANRAARAAGPERGTRVTPGTPGTGTTVASLASGANARICIPRLDGARSTLHEALQIGHPIGDKEPRPSPS